jgi:hypothetical protein
MALYTKEEKQELVKVLSENFELYNRQRIRQTDVSYSVLIEEIFNDDLKLHSYSLTAEYVLKYSKLEEQGFRIEYFMYGTQKAIKYMIDNDCLEYSDLFDTAKFNGYNVSLMAYKHYLDIKPFYQSYLLKKQLNNQLADKNNTKTKTNKI